MSEEEGAKSTQSHVKPIFRIRSSHDPKRRRRLQRVISSSSSSSSDEDESIHSKAARNHLSAGAVRNIIKNVVQNEFVIAAVQQRADELERQVEQGKERIADTIFTESPEGQKMTRKRARELNQSSLPISDLNYVAPDKSIAELIQKDLTEDDPDEEYEPNYEDEDDTDEYSTATCSDIDSQPPTPVPLETADIVMPPLGDRYDIDKGLFKMPLSPAVAKPPSRSEETISRRTRSKVSLETTAIEVIQQPFNPPDVTLDITESDLETDEPWKEFLEQFQMPLEAIEQEDGEETDPEYVFNEALDRTNESDSLVVPDREANWLLKELFTELEENVDRSIPFDSPLVSLPPERYYNPALFEEEDAADEQEEGTVDDLQRNIVQEPFEFISPAPGVEPVAAIIPASSVQPNFSIIQGSDQQLYLLPTMKPPQTAKEAKPKTAFLQVNVVDDWTSIMAQINHQRIVHHQFMQEESRVIDGWTAKSLRIYQRQLLVHIQLLGQMFVQTFSHLTLWTDAKHHLKLLEELKVKAEMEAYPFLKTLCWNLDDMWSICKDWEAELNVESAENQDYVRGLVSGKFHSRVMERFVNHRAFVFQEYLPSQAAVSRVDCKHSRTVPGRVLLCVLFLRDRKVRSSKGKKLWAAFAAFKERYGETRNLGAYATLLQFDAVKEYFQTGKVPQINAKELEIDCYDDVIPHAEKPCGALPSVWSEYVFSSERRQRNGKSRPVVEKKEEVATANCDQKDPLVTMNFPNFKAQFQLPNQPVYYGIGDNVPEADDELSTDGEELHIEEKAKDVRKKRSIRKLNRGNLVKLIKEALETQKRRKKCPALAKVRERKHLTRKLYSLLVQLDREYDENLDTLEPNLISTKIFNYLKEFDLFVRLLFIRTTARFYRRKKVIKVARVDDKEEAIQEGDRLPSKPIARELTNERDPLFAWKYVKTVEKSLKMDFSHFLAILRRCRTVPDFYVTIEDLLPEFPELLHMFLVHLLPGHVAQLGKFFEETICENPRTFRANLSLYISKQRVQWKAIFAYLNELAEEPETGMVSIKERFMEIFDGNPLIREWFLFLFPAQRLSATAMQFDCLENEVVLPVNLCSLFFVAPDRQLEDAKSPPLNLQLSDSDVETDSVIFMGVDEEVVHERSTVSMYSVLSNASSSDSDESFSNFGITEQEIMHHVSGESAFDVSLGGSLPITDESDTYATDYTS